MDEVQNRLITQYIVNKIKSKYGVIPSLKRGDNYTTITWLNNKIYFTLIEDRYTFIIINNGMKETLVVDENIYDFINQHII